MASPFPGMDPYLEGEMWQEFHETLAGAIRAQIMSRLPRTYVALLAKRYVVDRPALGIFDVLRERVIYPDVHVVAPPGRPSDADSGDTGVAIARPTVELPSVYPADVPQLTVEIRDMAERRLVTIIEIVSPFNKRGDGARDYAARRLELMRTQTHILEIDLLRQGIRIQLSEEPPQAPYYIYLSRLQRRPLTEVWTLPLRQPLPTVPVPLLPPDPDVPLDMQAAVQACFDLVGYERLLDYTGPPPPPDLTEADAAWVDEVLHAANFRPSSHEAT
jgi:hypothetical protein